MARRKSPVAQEHRAGRSTTSSELTLEVATLVDSVCNLTEFWAKATDGRPVPLGHSSMPHDVAERISQALSSISGSVAKAAAVLEQTAQGLGHEADVDTTTREAYAKVLSATSFLRDLGVLTPDHAEPVKPPPVLPQQTAPEVKAAAGNQRARRARCNVDRVRPDLPVGKTLH